MVQNKEPRFTNARKVDLGDFVVRSLLLRDPSLKAGEVRKVCNHLYGRLRTKAGLLQLAKLRDMTTESQQ